MTGIDHYTAAIMESFPKQLTPGLLYVSLKYSTAAHVCPCGCGQRVVTKLSPARWRVIFDGEVSLRPSVASTGMPCRSHYFITRGTVVWPEKLDEEQAARDRRRAERAVRTRHDIAAWRGLTTRLRRWIRRPFR